MRTFPINRMVKLGSKNKFQTMRTIYIFLFFFVFSWQVSAQSDVVISIPYGPTDIETAISSGSQESIYFNDLVNYSTLPSGDVNESTLTETSNPAYKVDSLFYVLSFRTNPFALPSELNGQNFEATITYELISYSDATGLTTSPAQEIKVDYDALGGTKYVSKAYKLLTNMPYVRLNIISLTIFDRNSSIVITNASQYDNLLELRQNLTLQRTYVPNPSQAPTNALASATSNNGHLRFTWKPLTWADSYDLEYLYVDDFAANGTPTPPLNIAYDFRRNSTRVEVPDNGTGVQEYFIPRIFDYGYVLFRVRGVGAWGTNPVQRIEGIWTLPDQANSLPGAPGPLNAPVHAMVVSPFTDTHEQGAMNWQHVTSFVEDGKRKDVITYFDGTLRERQSSTNIDSENNIITSEQIYDHAGRAAIQFLPTPHRANATGTDKPAFSYFQEFNLDGGGLPFDVADFEYTSTTCADPLPSAGTAVSNSIGAGNYYSPNNADKANQQAYVPDSEGFPYAQIEYTPDGTGKVRRQGDYGPDFQLGSGHEVKYFYTSPGQDELDRVFGTDVGFAKYYQKEVIVDANGQAMVSYKNSDGQLIATALAGESPDNMVALDNQQTQNITLSLLEAGSLLDEVTNSLFSSKSLYISGESGTTVPVVLDYQISNTSYVPTECPSACYSCVYDLVVDFKRDCGTVVFDTTLTIGSLVSLTSCDPLLKLFTRNMSIEPGEYIFSRRLVVNNDAIETAVEDYVENCVDIVIPLVPPGSCDPVPCNPCPPIETTYINYGNESYIYQVGGSILLPTYFPPIMSEDCSPFCEDNLPNIIETTFQTLLSDVSPGGQYGEFIDSTRMGDDPRGLIDPDIFPLSVFNTESTTTATPNQLPIENSTWRFPAGGIYRDRNGDPSLVEIPLLEDGELDATFYQSSATIVIEDGISKVRPQDINRLKDFVAAWQSSWAFALVIYHPEYPYYLYSRDFYDSYEADQNIQQTEFYGDATSIFSDLTDTDYTNDFSGDPFLDGISGARAEYNTMANKYIKKEEANPDLTQDYSIVQATPIVVHCGHPLFTPAEIESCQNANILFSSTNNDILDTEWQTYRSMAIDVKQRVLQEFRQDWIESNNYFSNENIASPSNEIYFEKKKRFPTNRDAEYNLPDEKGNDFTDDLNAFKEYYQIRQYQACGKCPEVDGFGALLNALFDGGLFETTTELGKPGNPSIPEILIDDLNVTTSDPVIWTPQGGNAHEQTIFIYANGSTIIWEAGMVLQSDILPFSEIKFITCIETVVDQQSGLPNFFAKGYNEFLDSTNIVGVVQGINFSGCDIPETYCRDTTFADDMKVFLDYIFQNDIYDDSNFDLFDAFGVNPALTDEMEDALNMNNVIDWRWQMLSLNTAGTSLLVDWEFTFVGGSTLTRIFDMTISDPSFDIRDVEKVLGVRKRAADSPAGILYDFEMIVEDVNGFEFVVSVNTTSDYFPVIYCTSIPTNIVTNQAFCCVRPVRYDPGPSCTEIFDDIAEGNRRLEEEGILDSLKNKFRTEYIANCLNASEQFTADYQEKLYHFTLYYYDQANNLVQTVPPKGVDYLTDSEVNTTQSNRDANSTNAALPNHTLVSSYSFNSLDKPIEKINPDEGIMEYTYDELGRVILSRDAVQANNDQSTYLLYDEKGQVEELGTVDYSIANLPSQMNYSTFLSTVALGTKNEIFNIFYDDPLAGTDIHFDGLDRNLRNRISSSTYQETEGTPYDHATHYGYDVLGNTHTLIQDFALLDREFPLGPSCSNSLITFNSETVEDGTYQTTNEIQTLNNVNVDNGSEIIFRSETGITLNPGFTGGYDFTAHIQPCAPSEGMATVPQHIKKIRYEYDLFSGNVKQMRYQPNEEDELIHFYEYDADNRLTNVSTTTFAHEPVDLRDVDASYEYYQHGPLARVEIGEEQIQGLDYAYTINGWMKGMNSATLFPDRDIGKDGATGSMNSLFGRDAYGFQLGYFDNDYNSIQNFSTSLNFLSTTDSPLPEVNFGGLYNGSIWYSVNANNGFSTNPIQLHGFQYDQLNRLKQSRIFQNPNLGNNSWVGINPSTAFATSYNYDPNGNMYGLKRYDAAGDLMDHFVYQLHSGTNRLNSVDDYQTTAYPLDLEDQANNNYNYDAKGRLQSDVTGNITAMEWYDNDKLKSITKNGITTTFQYNARGHRVSKKDLNKTTYYVRDKANAILAVYEIANDETVWKYSPINSTKPVGVISPNQIMDGIVADTSLIVRGEKQYEITNHIGNVQALVSDRKVPNSSGYFSPDILNAKDFYPFGMLMPGRQVDNQDYAFGFQGMELDNDLKGNGNSYTTEFRQYDSRLGRWLSVDPLRDSFPSHSPYNFVENNPNIFIDPNGLGPLDFLKDIATDVYEYFAGTEEENQIEENLEALGSAQERVNNLTQQINTTNGVLMVLRDATRRSSNERNRLNVLINELDDASRALTRASNSIEALENGNRVIRLMREVGNLPDPSRLSELTHQERLATAGTFDRIFRDLGGILESTNVRGLQEFGRVIKGFGEGNFFRENIENILHTEGRMERMRRDPAMHDVRF